MKNIWKIPSLIASLLGLIVSLYLYVLGSQTYCPTTSFECDVVLFSEYSHIMGIPLSLLGAIWFSAALMLSIIYSIFNTRMVSKILFGWCLTSIPSVATLVAIEIFLVNSICLFCTFAHILGLFLIIPAYKLLKSE